MKSWTTKEDNFLIENYGKISVGKIGEKIGRSRHSVYSRAKKLGLVKTQNKQQPNQEATKKQQKDVSIEKIISDMTTLKNEYESKCKANEKENERMKEAILKMNKSLEMMA